MTDQNQTQDQPQVEQPIDAWHKSFIALMQDAQSKQLFAPDVLLILQRASIDIQQQVNSLLFTHDHISGKE